MKHEYAVKALGLLLAVVVLSLGAWAQSDNANVSGVITDPSGATVPNAKVTLRNQANGLTREATTNQSGVYSIPTIPPGMYTITVEATGFKKSESKDNKVDPSVPASFSATLQVGSVAETVEVTATVTALQTESGALGKIIEGRQISDSQLNGRNPIFLALGSAPRVSVAGGGAGSLLGVAPGRLPASLDAQAAAPRRTIMKACMFMGGSTCAKTKQVPHQRASAR